MAGPTRMMTPWEVFCAAFKSDVGFTISSAAEPLHDDVECSLAELSDVQLRTLYQPPLIARESDAALRDTFADVMGSSFLFTEMPSHGEQFDADAGSGNGAIDEAQYLSC